MSRRSRVRFPDVLCFSHQRWGFIFDRPHHLMMRFARSRRVFFIEEPVFDAPASHAVVRCVEGVHIVVPHLAADVDAHTARLEQQRLLAAVLHGYEVDAPLAWFYSPMALPLIEPLETSGIVFDCMEDFSSRPDAPVEIGERELELVTRADVVFMSGHALHETKQYLHPRVHISASSVDVPHFSTAHKPEVRTPLDQQRIPRPRIGFAGVIDWRVDLALVREIAMRHPDWQVVMLGPVVGMDAQSLPRAANLHYLGMKPYKDLPAYLRGWDVALIPLVKDDAARIANPPQTLEYLAAGLPVVSTSIQDVVNPYGARRLVDIADSPAEFVAAIDAALRPGGRASVERAQSLLATMSWDRVFGTMCRIVQQSVRAGAMPVPVLVPSLQPTSPSAA